MVTHQPAWITRCWHPSALPRPPHPPPVGTGSALSSPPYMTAYRLWLRSRSSSCFMGVVEGSTVANWGRAGKRGTDGDGE